MRPLLPTAVAGKKKPSDPAKTLADVVRAGRTKPFDYASAGVGTASHVAAAYFFKILAKIDPAPFQEQLRKSGFYVQWRNKFGEEVWSLLEQVTGRLT